MDDPQELSNAGLTSLEQRQFLGSDLAGMVLVCGDNIDLEHLLGAPVLTSSPASSPTWRDAAPICGRRATSLHLPEVRPLKRSGPMSRLKGSRPEGRGLYPRTAMDHSPPLNVRSETLTGN